MENMINEQRQNKMNVKRKHIVVSTEDKTKRPHQQREAKKSEKE